MKCLLKIQVLLLSAVVASCLSVATSAPVDVINSPTPTISVTNAPATDQIFLDARLSADGEMLAVYTLTGIYLYDTTTLEKTVAQEFEEAQPREIDPAFGPGAVVISPDERTVAFSGLSEDIPVTLMDIESATTIGYIRDIPNGYYVTQLQFSPKGDFLYIRSEYPRFKSLHCTNNGVDSSFTLLKLADKQDTGWFYPKFFEWNGCTNISDYSKAFFTNNDKFYLYIERDMTSSLTYVVDIGPGSTYKEQKLDDSLLPYDISTDGSTYAVFNPDDARQRLTTLIDAETLVVLKDLPYMVKLFNSNDRYLVRGDIYEKSNWGLWENGRVVCEYDGLVYPYFFVWEISANNEVFISYRSLSEIVIWDVATCLIRNTLKLGE